MKKAVKIERKESANIAKMTKSEKVYKPTKGLYTTLNNSQPRKNTLTGGNSRTQKGATLVGFETSRLRILGVVPFCGFTRVLDGGENIVNDKVLFEDRYSLFFKVFVYKNRIVLERPFGVQQSYPFSGIASLHNTINGVVIETNSGKKSEKILANNLKRRKEFYALVSQLLAER